MKQTTLGGVYLFISVLLYSIMPVLIRLLGKGHVPPLSQVFLRYCVACIVAILYFYGTNSRFTVHKKDRLLLFFVALFGYALVNVFYTYANLNTQIGTVLFIFNCSTIMGPLLGYLFLKERLSAIHIIAMIIGFISLLFLFTPGTFSTWKIGAIFALVSAVGSSFYVIGRKLLGQYDSKLILLANTVVGVVVVGFLALSFEGLFYRSGIYTVSLQTWITIALFGLDNFAAYLFMTRGFQLVTAGSGSMIMLTENVVGVLFALLFFREIPTVASMVGGGLIIAASLMVLLASYPTRSND